MLEKILREIGLENISSYQLIHISEPAFQMQYYFLNIYNNDNNLVHVECQLGNNIDFYGNQHKNISIYFPRLLFKLIKENGGNKSNHNDELKKFSSKNFFFKKDYCLYDNSDFMNFIQSKKDINDFLEIISG